MTSKKLGKICKGIAIGQSIIAPGLIAIGHFTKSNIVKGIGIGWCALVAADSARITSMCIDAWFTNDELKTLIQNKTS